MRLRSNIKIRRATPGDARAIAVVLCQAFVQFKSLYTEAGFAATTPAEEQILARVYEGPVWVALLEGVMLGTGPVVAKNKSLYIRGMAVLPSARGSGIGARLLRQIETLAVKEGHTRLFLSTTPFLDSAIRLYEKSGFRRTSEGPHDLFGAPLFTMEKILGGSLNGPHRASSLPSTS